MDTYLLFSKKTHLNEDGLPWLKGAETHTFTAKRNTSSLSNMGRISEFPERKMQYDYRGD